MKDTSHGQPTVVLVHGALTDASVWNGAASRLRKAGCRVVAPALPMRGLGSDAAYLRSFLGSVPGPIVLVGHSYAGSVISHPAAVTPGVKALVFISAFQPDEGESSGGLNEKFAGSRLGPDTTTVLAHPGGNDMYLKPECFREVYAGDLPPETVATMAASQRPIDPAALGETLPGKAAWHTLPSWSLVSTQDFSLPPELLRFMAGRAGSRVVEVDSSHASPVSRPDETARLIAEAARSVG
ncbi:alpha/beta fold hydrolase [Streptantibioticus silvisoli]|jgi:pimeloyl-ACP methyl ester carboxylesterase|uniref:Alpha/beta hydrolase n=1 Tax=Streptantibioticus silvisoli TaxID=2705255 RepID=A0ABT6VYJ2_9ACTN|nr:alpha/beta hydrolase [Streptantibioticus silvisoli]MDI5962346.1 alpha/beta hydrolase [Streptantibioticus silvisoli]